MDRHRRPRGFETAVKAMQARFGTRPKPDRRGSTRHARHYLPRLRSNSLATRILISVVMLTTRATSFSFLALFSRCD
jgi:hypothetical protein